MSQQHLVTRHLTNSKLGWRRSAAILFTLVLTAAACLSCGSSAPRPDWVHESPGVKVAHEIIVDGQRVFIAPGSEATRIAPFDARRLAAIDIGSGSELWSRPISQSNASIWTVASGLVLVVTPAEQPAARDRQQTLLALDGASGQEVWRVEQMKAPSNLVVRGATLFLTSSENELLCLDSANGDLLASLPRMAPTSEMDSNTADQVPVAFTEDAYYLLSPSGVLHSYSVPGGREAAAHQLELNGTPDAVAVHGSRAYVHSVDANWPGEIAVFDLTSGRRLWLAEATGGLSEEVNTTVGSYALLYKTSGLSLFDAVSGQPLYQVNSDAHWVSLDGAGKLLTLADGTLATTDLATGKLLWDAKTEGRLGIDVAAQNGFAYAISGAQQWGGERFATDIELFDLETGARLWHLKQRGTTAAFAGEGLLLQKGSVKTANGDAVIVSRMPLHP